MSFGVDFCVNFRCGFVVRILLWIFGCVDLGVGFSVD